MVYGAKIMDRFKPTDKVKVILASATVMNKPQGGIPKEQAWNHSAETRIKSGDDDKLLVSIPCYLHVSATCMCFSWGGSSVSFECYVCDITWYLLSHLFCLACCVKANWLSE